jgi:hypothetical protein
MDSKMDSKLVALSFPAGVLIANGMILFKAERALALWDLFVGAALIVFICIRNYKDNY